MLLQRMYPVLMYDTLVKITGGCKTPMGCRSSSTGVEKRRWWISWKWTYESRVVTLNLPRIALEIEGNKDEFEYLQREIRNLKMP